MATVKGVNRTIADVNTVLHTLDPGLFAGAVKAMVDTYEASGLAQSSIIEMGGEIPTGARILQVVLSFDALGGSVTLDVGDLEDTTRYINAESGTSAGSKRGHLADGVAYKVDMTTASTPDNQVVITVGGSGTVTGTIKLVVLYVDAT